jgi:acyl-CoA thioesterase FadM
MSFEYEWKIRSGDTDFSGRIYTPAVIDCLIEGVQDMLAAAGLSQQQALSEGLLYPAVHAEADYLGEIRIEDVIEVALTTEVGDTSITVRGTGRRDGEVVFRGEVILVIIDEDEEPVPVPSDLREGLATVVAD